MAKPRVLVTRLPNGLTVVAEEQHHAPVVSFWMGYQVGSRNEQPGRTGVAHWIEHMLFKPTDMFPGNERDRLISREGGITNAFTWFDGTAYLATLPAPKADLMYRIEADRMANSAFSPEIVETERTVVLAERQSYENHPDWRLAEQVVATAFQVHPYRHEVIGLTADLERITRDDLYEFYRVHYAPNNAVAVAVGSFETGALLRRLEELFGSIPPGPEPPPMRAVEPPPAGERRITIEGPGATSYLEISYLAPAATDADFIPAMILAIILGGPISLALGSDGDSRTARLYKALVTTELAIDVDCNLEATIDPYLMDVSAVLWSGRTHAEVEAAIDAVLADVVARPVPAAELAKAKKQALSQFVFGNERITNRAMMLALAHMVFSMDLLESFPARIEAVAVEDVQRVAARLLQKRNRVVGWYVPVGGDGAAEGDEEDEGGNDTQADT